MVSLRVIAPPNSCIFRTGTLTEKQHLGDREFTVGLDVYLSTEERKPVKQVHLLADYRILTRITQRQITAHAHRQHRKGGGHADLSAPDDRHLRMTVSDLS